MTGDERAYVNEVIDSHRIGTGGKFTAACQSWLTDYFDTPLALPTGSCTTAMEMAALLLDLGPGDEFILPSYGYPTTASAFARGGATPVFVDVDPLTMNIDPAAVESAITPACKVIVPIHYGGVPCDMDKLMDIAQRRGLTVIEDAANAFGSSYKGKLCGTIGTFGCFSFHETKALHCGQGGALLVNDPAYIDRAEIILEKGTDRRQFLRDEVDKYTWRSLGSSCGLENLRAAFLWAQLQASEHIVGQRKAAWQEYDRLLRPLAERGKIDILQYSRTEEINGQIFWLKAKNAEERDRLIDHLSAHDIGSVFHYVPLHSSEAGRAMGRYSGDDRFTTSGSDRLLRLPMYLGLDAFEYIVETITAFYD